jgi:hypothetical protein
VQARPRRVGGERRDQHRVLTEPHSGRKPPIERTQFVHPTDGGDHPLPHPAVNTLVLDDPQIDPVGGVLPTKQHGAPFRDTTIATTTAYQNTKPACRGALHFRDQPRSFRK